MQARSPISNMAHNVVQLPDARATDPVLRRHPGNPILTGRDFPEKFRIQRVFNAGIIKHDGRYVMACRVEDRALRNRIWMAESHDGLSFTPRPAPVELPHHDPEFAEYTAGMY